MEILRSDIDRVLYTSQQIQNKIKELARSIDNVYVQSDKLTLIGILKGSYLFLGDLSRELTIPHQIDFMSVSSYTNTESSGNLKIEGDLRNTINGRDVLIIEDIVDTGRTLSHLIRLLLNRNPASLQVCTLLDKSSERVVDVNVKFIGFDVNPPQFVVGYGLDYNERYRDLRYIGVPTQKAIADYSK